MLAAIVLGLSLGVWLFLAAVVGKISFLYEGLNLVVTIIRSFPFLLFVVALIPLTRMLLGRLIWTNSRQFPFEHRCYEYFCSFDGASTAGCPPKKFLIWRNPLASVNGNTFGRFYWWKLEAA